MFSKYLRIVVSSRNICVFMHSTLSTSYTISMEGKQYKLKARKYNLHELEDSQLVTVALVKAQWLLRLGFSEFPKRPDVTLGLDDFEIA